MTWGPMPQPVLRQVLLWETGVLALSVVSVPLVAFVAQIQGVGQLWWRLLRVSPNTLVGQPWGGETHRDRDAVEFLSFDPFARVGAVTGKRETRPFGKKSSL